uniref:hypothetical protein n=1 Tax=Ningiella ruwaisensis TaxID=2364274 RepID=UPI0010A09FEF|nr:hypothetical protein [Ningiella ruwaisensis]
MRQDHKEIDQQSHVRLSKVRRERRVIARERDAFYRLVIGLNAVGWLTLVMALVVFHYARPEFITGVQQYWNIEGREVWSQHHLERLLLLLQLCLALSLISIVLRARRNRRSSDRFGFNLIILSVISLVSLFSIYLVAVH